MDDGADLPGCGANQNQDPPAFDSSACGAAAGPNKSEHHQQHFGELWPQVIVVGGEPGGGHDGRHLESGVAEAIPHRPVHIPDIPGNGEGGHGHHDKEKPQLIALQRLPELAGEGEEVDGKVDGEEQHERRDNDFDGGAAKCPHRGVPIGEAAGARRGHGVGDGIVPVHPRQAQQQRLQRGERQIDGV